MGTEAYFLGVKGARAWIISLTSSLLVKDEWIFTYIFTIWLRDVDRDIFTFNVEYLSSLHLYLLILDVVRRHIDTALNPVLLGTAADMSTGFSLLTAFLGLLLLLKNWWLDQCSRPLWNGILRRPRKHLIVFCLPQASLCSFVKLNTLHRSLSFSLESMQFRLSLNTAVL